ncbi:type IV toxin-antitoxin system AbiEi family antitoxin domain-containing protein [Terrabacter terrigena]|uniref:Type IV toxin-antitoxin system AbiEi family antitoxin domain-containing protein n=1 Tax=Terrabacter terrigena TaxID=574718 RepID=A0ABW3MZP6_9MICO
MDLGLIARDGVFSTADATAVGLDRNALSRLVRDGLCVRLATGWYAIAGPEPPDREELHRLCSLAMGRALRDRAALSHHSSLVARGLPTFGADFGTVHLTSLVPARGGVSVVRSGVAVHRRVGRLRVPDPDDVPEHLPRHVPTAWAAVQAGLLAGPEAFLVPADAALRAGSTTVGALQRAVQMFSGHTGVGPVRMAAHLLDARHESPGESRTAFVVSALGYRLEPQVEILADGRLFRADFRIAGTRVLVEFDGAVKYADRMALFEEKQREDALRRAGWVVARLVWADLDRPGLVARRIEAAVALVRPARRA